MLGAIKGWIQGQIIPILLGVVLALSVALSGGAYLYNKKVEEVGEQAAKIEQIEEDLTNLSESVEQNRIDSYILQENVRRNNSDLADTKEELNQYRGRQAVVAAKPGLVEIKINKSFNEFMDRLSCSTGDKGKCENQQ
jgi:outer membrane murein-binding lipoprotein Lpp